MALDPQKEVILKDYPIGLWLGGGISIAMSLMLVLFVGGQDEEMRWPLLISMVIGLPLALLGAVLTVSLDSGRGVLHLHYRSLLHHSTKEYPVSDVAAVLIGSSRSSKGGRTYRVELVLKSGERVPLRSYYSSGRDGKESQAARLRAALGLAGGAALTQAMPGRAAQLAPAAVQQSGTTSGVSWTIETMAFGTVPIARWRSSDLQFPGHFLLLVQKPASPESAAWLSGRMGGLSTMLIQRVVAMYGFTPADMPGLDGAGQLEALDPRLDPHFESRTTDPAGARQLLNPWTVQPLAAWVQQHPMQQLQAMSQGSFGQLLVLFAPGALYVATFNAATSGQVEELVNLGVELVRAQGSSPAPTTAGQAW
jgi:hypothetical protein